MSKDINESKQPKFWERFVFVLVVLFILGILLWSTLVNFVDQHEVGYKFNLNTGEVIELPRTGYFFTPPWVRIGSIDLRPTQVCINANSRVLNCKLVRFNPKGLALFIEWHGRSPDNSVSEILKSYAYDGMDRNYPFLTIVTELKGVGELDYGQDE